MKAFILAAGFGKRLGELTANTPKCLIKIGDKTILQLVVEHLKAAGVTDFAINTHYLANQVEEFVEKSEIFRDVNVQLFREEKILGTGGGLKNCSDFFGSDNFIVHNADIYEEFDIAALWKEHTQNGAIATLATVTRQTTSCVVSDKENNFHGLCKTDEGREPQLSAGFKAFTYTGVQCVSPKIFQYMQDEEGEFGIFPIYEKALAGGEVIKLAYQGQAYYTDMGTPQSLEQLRQYMAKQTYKE